MSPTWEPPSDAYDFGASLGLTNVDVERETAKFKDYYLARTSTALHADWAATWRLWLRRAAEYNAVRSPNEAPGRQTSTPLGTDQWNGPEAVLEVVAAAGLSGYLGYFTWRDVPERALVTNSPTIHAKLKPVERSLRAAGWQLLLERAA